MDTVLVNDRALTKHPKDPWEEELIFTCPGVHNPDGADVVSKGPLGRAAL